MEDICKCHCGTRIVVDDQLLEERETWREKYLCLQKQATNDIGRLKENIYAECATLMQQEFTAKDAETNQSVNHKNVEIRDLTCRIVNLEARNKIAEKEAELLRSKAGELELDIGEKDRLLQGLRSQGNKSERDWEVRLEEEVTLIRKRITQQSHDTIHTLETENDHLKHKVKQFQKKYQIIIPEVEKLKANLTSKNEQLEQLENKLQKLKKESEQQIQRAKQEVSEIEKVHSKCRDTIRKLSDKADALAQELDAARKVKREVKVEPVYIERPVEVQKIVQKIVEVEKVVTKYIEPTSFRDEELEGENGKLKAELLILVKELQLFEDKHHFTINDYEESIRQHEENASKYKKEREALARTIEEQHKEIDMIHLFLEKRKVEAHVSEPERIVVHVSKDGSYQKTVERVGTSNSNGNSGSSVPVNIRGAPKRR